MENNLDEEIGKFPATVKKAIAAIPTGTRRNFFKAFRQLCSDAIAGPMTWLENRTAELKDDTNRRQQLIENERGEELISAANNFSVKASAKYTSKILREQANLDDITLHAANELAKDIGVKERGNDHNSEDSNEIEDDWLNEFESHARLKSSEDMKLIFGKILSGEISKPGSFSIRTIRLISQLDANAARIFQIFCSNAISMRVGKSVLDARVVAVNGNAASNGLRQYGLSFDTLNVLQEYGLVISDYNSYMGYSACIANQNNEISASIYFNNKYYGLLPINRETISNEFRVHGVALTKAGKELIDIIPVTIQEGYQQALFEYFERNNLRMIELKVPGT